jgi:hypothetical protein
MMFLFLLAVLAATAAAIWFQGLWNATVTLVNMILAMVIATSLYEPICTQLEKISNDVKTFTYLLDFIVLWLLFAIAFGVLRAITDAISKKAVEFDFPVEVAGRSILAIVCGWVMVCFVAFSLQMAPLNSANPLGAWATPTSKTFGPFSPDRMWIGFMHSRTTPSAFGPPQFDPKAEFLLKYRERREKYSAPGSPMRFPL